ncbi:MAG: hypothetical protein WAZ12_01045 [Candidatus Absconditicoccaceae bacterium]
MKLLAFTSKNAINQTYASLLNKYRTYQGIIDIIKIGGLALTLLFFMLIYLYFINKSSTQGYFLRQANNDLNTIKFKYEIVKTNVLNYKQQNRQEMHETFGNSNRVVDIRATIVSIPPSKELTLNDR